MQGGLRKGLQKFRLISEAVQRVHGGLNMGLRIPARLLRAHAGGPGQLALRRVLAGGFAQQPSVSLQIQQIVHNLKGQAQMHPVDAACGHRLRPRAAQ